MAVRRGFKKVQVVCLLSGGAVVGTKLGVSLRGYRIQMVRGTYLYLRFASSNYQFHSANLPSHFLLASLIY